MDFLSDKTAGHELSATSAYVLLLSGKESYPLSDANGYFDCLDLTPGKSYFDNCFKIWPHYDQVIKNRKFTINKICSSFFEQSTDNRQVIILAAGLAPLSLELALAFSSVNIFDTDRSFMDLKLNLMNRLHTDSSVLERIKCVSADIRNPELLHKSLVENGWNPSKPSLIVAEGISYYIEKTDLYNIFRIFKTDAHENFGVIEYLVPLVNINPEYRQIPEKVFNLISQQCCIKTLSSFEYIELQSCVNNLLSGHITEHYTLHKMELFRKGCNLYFPADNSGWIEICSFLY